MRFFLLTRNINSNTIRNLTHFHLGRLSSGENYMNMVVHRLEYLNWLDPLRTSCPNGDSGFHRADLFARPTARELRLRWAGGIGGTRIINCFNSPN